MRSARIAERDLGALVEGEIDRAAAAGCRHIRRPAAFQAHLIDVAVRAERVAAALQQRLPPDEAPDPAAAFIAGAWHDGGKIWNGDDYHEITSAAEVIENGAGWALVPSGSADARKAIFRRAAAAIIPHFAIYEQWQPSYVPTAGCRPVAAYRRLVEALGPAPVGFDPFLPFTVDALVVMYSDMGPFDDADHAARDFEGAFERRWQDVTRSSEIEDRALARILPAVRPRIHDGCALIDQFLARGFDADELRAFRLHLAHWRRSSAVVE